jgi:hypothetical protein
MNDFRVRSVISWNEQMQAENVALRSLSNPSPGFKYFENKFKALGEELQRSAFIQDLRTKARWADSVLNVFSASPESLKNSAVAVADRADPSKKSQKALKSVRWRARAPRPPPSVGAADARVGVQIHAELNWYLFMAGAQVERISLYSKEFPSLLPSAAQRKQSVAALHVLPASDSSSRPATQEDGGGGASIYFEEVERSEMQFISTCLALYSHELLLLVASAALADEKQRREDAGGFIPRDPFFAVAQDLADWMQGAALSDASCLAQARALTSRESVGLFSALLYAEDAMRLVRRAGKPYDAAAAEEGGGGPAAMLGATGKAGSKQQDRPSARGGPQAGSAMVPGSGSVFALGSVRGGALGASALSGQAAQAAREQRRIQALVDRLGEARREVQGVLRGAAGEAYRRRAKLLSAQLTQSAAEVKAELPQAAAPTSDFQALAASAAVGKAVLSAARFTFERALAQVAHWFGFLGTASRKLQRFGERLRAPDFGESLDAIKAREKEALAKDARLRAGARERICRDVGSAEPSPGPWRTHGLTSLGPFGLLPAPGKDLRLQTRGVSFFREGAPKSPGSYVVEAMDPTKKDVYLRQLDGLLVDGKLEGKLSYANAITVDQKDLGAADENRHIAKFAWAYPVSGITEAHAKAIAEALETRGLPVDAVDYFLLNGGYVYWPRGDAAFTTPHEILSLVVGAFKMRFEGPRPLDPKYFSGDQLQHWGAITIDVLSKAPLGAKQFRWFSPAECAVMLPRAKSKVHFGAFGYLYEGDTAGTARPPRANFFMLMNLSTA